MNFKFKHILNFEFKNGEDGTTQQKKCRDGAMYVAVMLR